MTIVYVAISIVGLCFGLVIGWFACRSVVIALRDEKVSVCAFCGETWPVTDPNSDEHRQSVIDHIMTCDKHPMRIEIENALNLAERDGLLAIGYYEQLKVAHSKLVEIDRLLTAQPDTLEAKDYILSEISDIVNNFGLEIEYKIMDIMKGDNNDTPTG
jgi:hypothetical protein